MIKIKIDEERIVEFKETENNQIRIENKAGTLFSEIEDISYVKEIKELFIFHIEVTVNNLLEESLILKQEASLRVSRYDKTAIRFTNKSLMNQELEIIDIKTKKTLKKLFIVIENDKVYVDGEILTYRIIDELAMIIILNEMKNIK